jgi:uncharacterized protein YxjI
MKPRLFIEQRITAFVNKYKVLGTTETGEKGGLVAFAQQKRLAFREKVTFYQDEAKTTPIFTLRAEKVLDVHGRYFVEDMNGQLLGMFQKRFAKSLINSTWIIMDTAGNQLFVVQENNMVLAVLRRFISFVPYFGDILEIVIKFFKYHFQFMDEATNTEVGMYEKITLIRDQYKLSMTDEAVAKTDWRLLAAIGVALDALQSR